MIFGKTLIPRVVLFGSFAIVFMTTLAIAQTPSPALVITFRGSREVAIIDPQTNKIVGRVPVGHLPHELAVSDDGKFAFATTNNRGDINETAEVVPDNDFISVVDLVAQKELRRVQTGIGSFPHGIRFVGGKVYYTAQGYETVARYDPGSNQIDWMMGTAQGRSHMLVMTKDAKRIFTANTFSDTVSVIAPWESEPNFQKNVPENVPLLKVTQIPVGSGPEGIAMSPDEKEVWALNRGSDSASIIDVATKKVTQTLNLHAGIPLRMAFTPDGKRALIVTFNGGDVLILDTATRKEIKRISLGKAEPLTVVSGIAYRNGVEVKPELEMHGVLITPDGWRAYIGMINSDYLAVIDLRTYEVTGRIPTGRQPEALAWADRK
jgi:YVTN family beta-propeller protein